MIDDNDTTNATTMMLNYSMNITNYTPHHEPSPHRPCQDPLDRTRRSLHRHRCRRRPPSPSLSATTAIITIMGLVGALCHLPAPSSSSLLSNAAATPPTKESPQPRPRSPPPLRSSPPRRLPALYLYALLIAHGAILDGMQRRRPLVQRGECRSRPCTPCRKTG
jgi:hypothetical protein